MRALPVHQAVAPGAVTKQHQVLAKDLYQSRYIGDLTRQRDRLPVTAQVFAAGAAGRRAHQQFIAFPALRRTVAVVGSGRVDRGFIHDFSPAEK